MSLVCHYVGIYDVDMHIKNLAYINNSNEFARQEHFAHKHDVPTATGASTGVFLLVFFFFFVMGMRLWNGPVSNTWVLRKPNLLKMCKMGKTST